MAYKQHESRSFLNALSTYLTNKGWTGLTFKEGLKSEATIAVPLLAISFLPDTKKALQLGGNAGENLFKRIIQVDCYMETEDRAIAINDDIMDFIDVTPVTIVNHTSAVLGTLICQDTDSIYSDTSKPLLYDPKLIRWRGIVRATLEAHYFAP